MTGWVKLVWVFVGDVDEIREKMEAPELQQTLVYNLSAALNEAGLVGTQTKSLLPQFLSVSEEAR